eukprot:scaffold56561_cov46-Phaeocystis_antarctica.AAC.3
MVRGAIVGGAAVGLVKTLLERQPKAYTTGDGDVSEADVIAAQKLWAESIASISKVHADKGDFVAAAGEAAGQLYGYGHGNVLFKPTKATAHPFRATGEEAMSCASPHPPHPHRTHTAPSARTAPTAPAAPSAPAAPATSSAPSTPL